MLIILCTTFRDFKGTENDIIQYKFLDSIKRQTYQNYKIVTTTFGEKKVKEVVDGYFGEKSIVRNVDVPPEYRFSLTDVVLSGVNELKQAADDAILVWCTCDIQFDKWFFQTLVNNYSKGISGIIHPNIIYNSLEDLEKRRGVVGSLEKGIDLLFFDKDTILKADKDIMKYRFYDWGVFEWFLVALAKKYASIHVNLFSQTKNKKVENNRQLTNESIEYFKRCIELNQPVFDNFIQESGLSDSSWNLMCYNAHKLFTISKPTLFSRYVEWLYVLFFTAKGKKILSKYHLHRVVNLIFNKGVIKYH